LVLNLGCGEDIKKECVNVDVTGYKGVDEVVDLSVFPWPWADESVSGIHASHIIEHFPDQKQFILECLRILKKGGFLRLKVPHSSNISAVGCMGHYRTYSYDTLNDYLARDFYMFKSKRFQTVEQKLLWWYESVDVQCELPWWTKCVILTVNPIINFLIRLSPRIFENTWVYWIGGAREVIWKGVKV
jgi:SAM-dependent methyltransferase